MTTSQLMFETERLLVRHFQTDDLNAFAELCADSEVMRYVGDGTTLSRTEVEHWIEVCQNKYATRGYGTSAVFEKTGAFIGYCGVVRAPGHEFDELIYVFHQRAWGRGYAGEVGRAMLTYVFAHSSLTRIYATIDAANLPSQRVADKLGMRLEREITEPEGIVRVYVTERD